MAFVSSSPRIGDKVILTHDVVVMKGTFKRGSIMRITGFGPRGPDMVDLDSGEALTEVFSNSYQVF